MLLPYTAAWPVRPPYDHDQHHDQHQPREADNTKKNMMFQTALNHSQITGAVSWTMSLLNFLHCCSSFSQASCIAGSRMRPAILLADPWAQLVPAITICAVMLCLKDRDSFFLMPPPPLLSCFGPWVPTIQYDNWIQPFARISGQTVAAGIVLWKCHDISLLHRGGWYHGPPPPQTQQ